MPHALAPALPSGNKRVGVDGIVLPLVAAVVFLIHEERNPHCDEFFLAPHRHVFELLIEFLSESLEDGAGQLDASSRSSLSLLSAP